MHEIFESTFDAHFDSQLIGPNMKLTRLHKGGKQKAPKQQPIPPPVRETLDTTAKAMEERFRRKKRFGNASTADPSTLMGTSENAGKTLLG